MVSIQCFNNYGTPNIEDPTNAFEYYRRAGIKKGIVEYKHMGSRAVVILTKSPSGGILRNGAKNACSDSELVEDGHISGSSFGAVITRNGRRFFNDKTLEIAFLQRLHKIVIHAGLWDSLDCEWICFDGEMLPWNFLSEQQIIDNKKLSECASSSLTNLRSCLMSSGATASETQLQFLNESIKDVAEFERTNRDYTWPVEGINNIRFCPFHIIGTSKEALVALPDFSHLHQMKIIEKLADESRRIYKSDSLINPTFFRSIRFDSQEDCKNARRWWHHVTTRRGAEGVVVKPDCYSPQNQHGQYIQPAIKVRGRKHLRLIYGPHYLDKNNKPAIPHPKHKAYVKRKREIAIKQHLLGIESAVLATRPNYDVRITQNMINLLAHGSRLHTKVS